MAVNLSNIDDQVLSQVLRLFRSELKLTTIDADDDFFDLGGDSLMAENLVMEINRHFKWSYDVSNIMDYPSPKAFAQDISSGLTKDNLIKPVPGCRGIEKFLFMHGAFGNNYQLRYLGDKVRARWDFFGIRALGVAPGEDPHSSLTEMMDRYLEVAKAHCGYYPTTLAGNCAGGILALEMARRIYDLTDKRMTVILLDPPASFHKRQQGVKPRFRFLQKLRYQYYKKLRTLIFRAGLGNTILGRNANRTWMLENIKSICGEVYPDPFPCNLLVFVGNKFMDKSFPSIQAWANDEVHLRGIPLPGFHRQIYEDNIQVIDKEIIDFVDDLKELKLYTENS